MAARKQRDPEAEAGRRDLSWARRLLFGVLTAGIMWVSAFLEQRLNEAYGSAQKYEAINLGVPHLTSAEVAPLFVAEALALESPTS